MYKLFWSYLFFLYIYIQWYKSKYWVFVCLHERIKCSSITLCIYIYFLFYSYKLFRLKFGNQSEITKKIAYSRMRIITKMMIERCLRWVFFFFKSSSPICDLKKGKILLFVSFCYQNIQHMIVLPHFVSPQINSVICFHFLTQWISVLWHEREYTRMSGCIFQNMFFLQWKRIKWEKEHRQTRVHTAHCSQTKCHKREKNKKSKKMCCIFKISYRFKFKFTKSNRSFFIVYFFAHIFS